MLPFGTHTATLYHKESGVYNRYVLSGVSWRQKDVNGVSDNALIHTVETVCRVPEGQQKPSTGDLLVKGICTKEANSDIEISRLRDSINKLEGRAFRVQSVKDNTDAPIPHYAVTGA